MRVGRSIVYCPANMSGKPSFTVKVTVASTISGQVPKSGYWASRGPAGTRLSLIGAMLISFMSFSMGSIRTAHGERPAGVPQARLARVTPNPPEVFP